MGRDKHERVAGMVFGSFVGDALSLGAHWIYDQEEIAEKHGRVTDYLTPEKQSYHGRKKAGEQTHYGDQAITLLDSLMTLRKYDEIDFAKRWRLLWISYPGYFDHATKETLSNMKNGAALTRAGANSEELGGAARIAPLLALLHKRPLEEKISAARLQTKLTHRAPLTMDAAEFLTRLTETVLEGEDIWPAVEKAADADYPILPVREMVQRVHDTRSWEMKSVARELGQACPAAQALPTTLALLARYPDDLETAFIENVMAGGDSAARGLALGMVLGAKHGREGIPERWTDGLRATPRIGSFLRRI